jgi:uncharacterized protein
VPASLLDSNVWVAATFTAHDFHLSSMDVLRFATRSQPILFCRATEQSFLRLVTSSRMLARYGAEGMTNRHALAALAGLQARPGVEYRDEPPGTVALWHRLADRDTASPKVWMDAYLASFAISGGLEFMTLDRDFRTYEAHGLRLRLLAPPSNA